MAATRVFSTAAYWVAGIVAILLGLSPKFGAIIFTMPPGVLGGVTTALYGLIGIIGVRIWVENKVDFSKPEEPADRGRRPDHRASPTSPCTPARLSFSGIILGTVAALVVYHLMNVLGKLRGTDVSTVAATRNEKVTEPAN